MIDIHTHIMPLIDDGSESIEESKRLIELEIEQGVTDIILTPHIINTEKKKRPYEDYLRGYNTIKNIVLSNDLNVNIYLGGEIFALKGVCEDLKNGDIKPIEGTNIILVEMPLTNIYSYNEIENILYNLNLHYEVILAHPERYHYLRIEDLFKLSRLAKMQINSGSIIGDEGSYIKKRAFQIIRNGFASFVASDCHNLESRKPNLLEAKKIVEKKFGLDAANDLFEKNPMDLIKKIRKNWID